MKESLATGGYIFDEIKKLEDEEKELNEALGELERGKKAYSLIIDARDKVHNQLRELRTAKWKREPGQDVTL